MMELVRVHAWMGSFGTVTEILKYTLYAKVLEI